MLQGIKRENITTTKNKQSNNLNLHIQCNFKG